MSAGNSLPLKVMLVHDQGMRGGEGGSNVRALIRNFEQQGMQVTNAADAQDAMILIDHDMQVALVDWNLQNDSTHNAACAVIDNIRQRKMEIPIFLFMGSRDASGIRVDILEQVEGFIWLDETNMASMVEEVQNAVQRYRQALLPAYQERPVHGCSRLTDTPWNNFDYTGQNAPGMSCFA